jgi:hypothetical protein
MIPGQGGTDCRGHKGFFIYFMNGYLSLIGHATEQERFRNSFRKTSRQERPQGKITFRQIPLS